MPDQLTLPGLDQLMLSAAEYRDRLITLVANCHRMDPDDYERELRKLRRTPHQ